MIRANRLLPKAAMTPIFLAALVVYVGCMAWTVALSFTASRAVPDMHFVGLVQWSRLFGDFRWTLAMRNLFVFGATYILGSLALGYALAIFVDQRVKGEGFFRTVFLCPHALSFIVTGEVWQWYLDPTLGLQKAVQALGWTGFRFDWLVDRVFAIYAIAIAGIWHGAGLVMVLMLAGIRGVDAEIWKATRVDGIPAWRTYLSIVLPMVTPSVLTSVALLGAGAIKNYDLVVAMTAGGPGTATVVPSMFVMSYLGERSNIALAGAGATAMLLVTIVIAAPMLYWRQRRAVRLGLAT
ncbi:MAG: sugar ABC transporter permease [Acetobacteraceae bacterium]|nr:sugar ABC transporter permease [Acetobacteraceae bacterium]